MSVDVQQSVLQQPNGLALVRSIRGPSIARGDVLLLGLTLARLALVPLFVATFLVVPAITTMALTLFIVADIYDGVLARRFDADGPTRRALDSIVDRIGIDAFLIGACVAGALPLPLLLALLARDLYCAVICTVMMHGRSVAIKADWVYRSLNLSVAAWALTAPFLSQTTRTVFAVALLAASIAVAIDLTRSVRRVMHAAPEMRDRVIRAGDLRVGASI